MLDYIEAHISRPIYLSELSKIAEVSRIRLGAQFRAATGLPPHTYILRRRIARAQEMLRNPDVTIVGVALDLGFSSQAHFTEAFRKVLGVTPGHWRREKPLGEIGAADC